MHTGLIILVMVIGLIFGVWDRYKEYYPTLLFWIIGNLLYETLLQDHNMWEFHPTGIDHVLLPTNTVISLAIIFLSYPFTVPVFLGRMPRSIVHKVLWIVVWASLYTGIEGFSYFSRILTYHHGWSMKWSFLFNLDTFLSVTIHYQTPWLAWVIAIISITILLIIFQPPIPT